jgi:DNA repair protein RadA/Sms
MPKEKISYVCENCGYDTVAWQGQCPSCHEWNTFREMRQVKDDKRLALKTAPPAEMVKLSDVSTSAFARIPTGIGEVDRVLGGGIVPGTVILLGGDPGIGKSTLLLQLAEKISRPVLYVSGEESPHQIKLRAERLGISGKNLTFLPETAVDSVIAAADDTKPALLIIDSIQTMYDPVFPSTPGSIVQVRETALKMQQLAKRAHIPVFLIGHMTKEGGIAGPRTLEHLVDVVLYLEGEHFHGTRILRGGKNRFGATDEIGVFAMGEEGLVEVKNPSELFLQERLTGVPGSAITATVEGTRPFLIEIQALVTPTIFGYPRRTTSGFDLNRLQLILAILQKRAGVKIFNKDVYVNVVGGVRLREPAADLAVALAIASAEAEKSLPKNLVVFGELGLSGEVRSVSHEKKRLTEAKRLGFTHMISAKTVSQAIKEVL